MRKSEKLWKKKLEMVSYKREEKKKFIERNVKDNLYEADEQYRKHMEEI